MIFSIKACCNMLTLLDCPYHILQRISFIKIDQNYNCGLFEVIRMPIRLYMITAGITIIIIIIITTTIFITIVIFNCRKLAVDLFLLACWMVKRNCQKLTSSRLMCTDRRTSEPWIRYLVNTSTIGRAPILTRRS